MLCFFINQHNLFSDVSDAKKDKLERNEAKMELKREDEDAMVAVETATIEPAAAVEELTASDAAGVKMEASSVKMEP